MARQVTTADPTLRRYHAPVAEPPSPRRHRPAPPGSAAPVTPGRPGPGATGPETLPAGWGRRWAADPGAPTVVERSTGRVWRAGELDGRTRAAADRLRAAGVVAGDRVLWSTRASLDAVAACLGALRLGAVVVPVNPEYTEREVAHIAGDVRPALALVDRPEQARRLWRASGGLTGSLPVDPADPAWPTEPAVPPGRPEGRPGPGQVEPPLDAVPGEAPALIVYTSGTTGSPKGAVLSHDNLAAGVDALQMAWRWEPADRLVLALPLFHVHGLCAGLLGALGSGSSVALLERFEPAEVLAEARSGSTLFFGVPTMYHRLVAEAGSGALSRLRLCVSGSAPLPPALWQAARRRAQVAILERYGMTETLLTLSNPYDGERRPGTVGFPLPGVEARLGADGPVRTGGPEGSGGPGEGELWVRGPTVFAGYWERPAETEACFDGDWFRTGDLAAADDDGYLSIRGRRQEVIISGGFNVYPAEVEDVLAAHPGVAEVAVTGTPSEEWGETVTAWVVPAAGGLASDALLAYAAARLAPYKRPRIGPPRRRPAPQRHGQARALRAAMSRGVRLTTPTGTRRCAGRGRGAWVPGRRSGRSRDARRNGGPPRCPRPPPR